MKPVDQTIFDDGHGDCFRACIASILELSPSSVPNFVEYEDMHEEAEQWLCHRGIRLVSLCFEDQEALDKTYFDAPAYCILGGISPRTTAAGNRKWHAVVGKAAGYGVRILHDPHPSRAGLKGEGQRWVRLLVEV